MLHNIANNMETKANDYVIDVDIRILNDPRAAQCACNWALGRVYSGIYTKCTTITFVKNLVAMEIRIKVSYPACPDPLTSQPY